MQRILLDADRAGEPTPLAGMRGQDDRATQSVDATRRHGVEGVRIHDPRAVLHLDDGPDEPLDALGSSESGTDDDRMRLDRLPAHRVDRGRLDRITDLKRHHRGLGSDRGGRDRDASASGTASVASPQPLRSAARAASAGAPGITRGTIAPPTTSTLPKVPL